MASGAIGSARLLALLGEWRDGDPSAYLALAARLRLLIVDGRLPTGVRLPSERDLAARFAIGRTTVNAAYDELRRTGFLMTRQGSGSVVRLPGRPGDLPVPGAGDLLDLSRATSGAAPGIRAAAHRALDRLDAHLPGDGYELLGLAALRVALATRYGERGLATEPDQVAVTSGGQSAISLIARTLVRHGDRVVVETPGYPHAFDAFRGAGARLVPLTVDPLHGWDVGAFEAMLQRDPPALAYLMPDFHNPTSRSMTDDDRARIVAAAERAGMVIVADETTAELALERAAPRRPLASFARRPGVVLSIGSASKTIWGGLRVGWIRGSREQIDRLVAARFANDLGGAVIDQLTVAEMMPELDTIIGFRADLHRASRDVLVAALGEHLPTWQTYRVDGGVAAWVSLGEPISSALAVAARRHALLIGAGPWFGLGGEYERFIRIPITASADAIARAVRILAEASDELVSPGARAPRAGTLI